MIDTIKTAEQRTQKIHTNVLFFQRGWNTRPSRYAVMSVPVTFFLRKRIEEGRPRLFSVSGFFIGSSMILPSGTVLIAVLVTDILRLS